MNQEDRIEEYLSSVRHDLRAQLSIVYEMTSQVLDGLGGKDCTRCFEMLRPVRESANKLNGLIGELLSASALKSILNDQQSVVARLNPSEQEHTER